MSAQKQQTESLTSDPARLAFFLSAGLTLGCLVGVVLLSGCTTRKVGDQKKKPVVFDVATRQLPPQPVYNRLTWVRPPEVLPDAEVPASEGLIRPVFHLSLKKVSVEEATASLASSMRYSSYVASTLASKKISIEALGTVDELAQALSYEVDADVVVDHEGREIRVLARHSESGLGQEPQFAQPAG
jgi:hypothetical protein